MTSSKKGAMIRFQINLDKVRQVTKKMQYPNKTKLDDVNKPVAKA
jgi:hypothetical protein